MLLVVRRDATDKVVQRGQSDGVSIRVRLKPAYAPCDGHVISCLIALAWKHEGIGGTPVSSSVVRDVAQGDALRSREGEARCTGLVRPASAGAKEPDNHK